MYIFDEGGGGEDAGSHNRQSEGAFSLSHAGRIHLLGPSVPRDDSIFLVLCALDKAAEDCSSRRTIDSLVWYV